MDTTSIRAMMGELKEQQQRITIAIGSLEELVKQDPLAKAAALPDRKRPAALHKRTVPAWVISTKAE